MLVFAFFAAVSDCAAVRGPFVWFRDGSRWTGFSLPDFYCALNGGNYRQRGRDGKLLEAGEMGRGWFGLGLTEILEQFP